MKHTGPTQVFQCQAKKNCLAKTASALASSFLMLLTDSAVAFRETAGTRQALKLNQSVFRLTNLLNQNGSIEGIYYEFSGIWSWKSLKYNNHKGCLGSICKAFRRIRSCTSCGLSLKALGTFLQDGSNRIKGHGILGFLFVRKGKVEGGTIKPVGKGNALCGQKVPDMVEVF